MYGIASVALVPVRSEPSDRSEMVTQLLFGESFSIVETKNQWRKIRGTYDDYLGWIDEKQFISCDEKRFQDVEKSASILSLDLVQLAIENLNSTPLLIGSRMPGFVAGKFVLGELNYFFEGTFRNCSKSYSKKTVVENAMMYLNAPYLWGGRSPFGIDCSGLTQMAYKLSGIKLWRDAAQQSTQGTTLHLLDEASPGDLLFFDNDEGKIIHTGILLSDHKIIHAAGLVRIDKIDHQGIFNQEKNRYTHNLRVIKKIF